MSNQAPKLVIIGMGYLMGYIYPCYERLLGEKVSTNIIAVTADEANIEKKRKEYPFEIRLNDNIGALREMQPDIILFAVPPKFAPPIAESVLKEYYDEVRAKGGQLPDLYCFPPSPKGKYYLDLLGDDINVCNILPNMTSEICGEKLHGEGITLITFPDERPWPEANRERIMDMFRALGDVASAGPNLVLKILGCRVAIRIAAPIIMTLVDVLAEQGIVLNHKDVASCMRACLQEITGFKPEKTYPCSRQAVPSWLDYMLYRLTEAIYRGARTCCVDGGMPEEESYHFFAAALDLFLHQYSREEREEILESMRNHATKGGVLEKGVQCSQVFVEPLLKKVLKNRVGHKLEPWFFQFIEDIIYETGKMVGTHGERLAVETPLVLDPSHHAILYGLLVRNALDIAGEKGKEAVRVGTKYYGWQRGHRMMLRAKKNGDPIDARTYKAYGEWEALPGTFEVLNIQNSPYNISWNFKCHWSTAWTRYGFRDEAYYYCESVDEAIADGFGAKLIVNGVKTDLVHDRCEFYWPYLDLSPENQEYIAKMKARVRGEAVKDFFYHCAHLYSAMGEKFREIIPDKAEEILKKSYDQFTMIYGAEGKQALDLAEKIDFNNI